MSAYSTYDFIGELHHPKKRVRQVRVQAKLLHTPTDEEGAARLHEVYPSASYTGFHKPASDRWYPHMSPYPRRITPVRRAITRRVGK